MVAEHCAAGAASSLRGLSVQPASRGMACRNHNSINACAALAHHTRQQQTTCTSLALIVHYLHCSWQLCWAHMARHTRTHTGHRTTGHRALSAGIAHTQHTHRSTAAAEPCQRAVAHTPHTQLQRHWGCSRHRCQAWQPRLHTYTRGSNHAQAVRTLRPIATSADRRAAPAQATPTAWTGC
jgi:hypothetical protein